MTLTLKSAALAIAALAGAAAFAATTAAAATVTQRVNDSIDLSRDDRAAFTLFFDSGFDFKPFETTQGRLTRAVYDFDQELVTENVTGNIEYTAGGITLLNRRIEDSISGGAIRIDLLNDFQFGPLFDVSDFTDGTFNVKLKLTLDPFFPQGDEKRVFRMNTFEQLIYTFEDFEEQPLGVAPVPVPAALPMAVAAFSGLAFLARRRRDRG